MGPVARAPAQVAAERVGHLPAFPQIFAPAGLEHRNDESRRAVAALRTVPLDHLTLDGMQRFAVAHTLDRHDFPSGDHRQQREATVDRAGTRNPVRVAFQHRHGTRSAVALRATFLGAPATPCAQKIEQRGVGRQAVHAHGFAVEPKLER